MKNEYILNSDAIERILEDYNNLQNKTIVKLEKLTMSTDTYDYLMTVKLIPLGMFADEIVIDDTLEYDVIKAVGKDDEDDNSENRINIRKPHHQSKYTKKKYVYKKKLKGSRKNRRK